MFILRRITANDYEMNDIIGDSYQKIDPERNPVDFKQNLTQWGDETEMIFMFLIVNQGSKTIPLYKKSQYYVMTSNGETFEKIVYK